MKAVEHTSRRARAPGLAAAALLLAASLAACGEEVAPTPPETGDDYLRARFDLQALGAIPYPEDNPPREERISLGHLLFFDPILGGEKDVSCGTCHLPEHGFADGRQFGAGVSGVGLGPDRAMTDESMHLMPRNVPTVLNTAFNGVQSPRPSADGCQLWDCRRRSLEVQATGPIKNRIEQKGDAYPEQVALDSVVARLREVPEYVDRFEEAFAEEAAGIPEGERASIVDSSTYARAVAAYIRELVGRNSAFDRFVRGRDVALTARQKRGLELFFTKAKCAECHRGPMFSNFQFVVNGTPQEGPGKDVIEGDDTGREEFTGDPDDRYKFRVPTLRNVAITPPYMHDGVFHSLEEVVRFYNRGGRPRHEKITDDMLHPTLRDPLGLDEREIDALVAFMHSLTDPGYRLPDYLTSVPEEVPSGLTPITGRGAER